MIGREALSVIWDAYLVMMLINEMISNVNKTKAIWKMFQVSKCCCQGLILLGVPPSKNGTVHVSMFG